MTIADTVLNSLPRKYQDAIWLILPASLRKHILWPISEPNDSWASFDQNPWKHPWLTQNNIKNFRTFSDGWVEMLLKSFEESKQMPKKKYAFVGNMANNLYIRACVLAKRNLSIDTHLHPHDQSLMGHPAWEEYDGDIPGNITTINEALNLGVDLPEIPSIYRHETLGYQSTQNKDLPGSMRFLDLKRFPDYFAYMPTYLALQKYDALLAVQVPYLAYLSGKPYAVTQMGGDIWYDCSRDDLLGHLQRASFSNASVFIISNPWSLAFGRRYKISNMIYLPFLLDEVRYSPGPPIFKEQWRNETGGDFFVMMSSRIDYAYKGSNVAINAFAQFSKKVPTARLIVTDWGSDKSRMELFFEELGISDKVLVIPPAGKRMLINRLRSADCLIDQLILGYYGASALEAMACGLPVIMNLNQAQYDSLIPEGCAPVCQASTNEQVFHKLLDLYNDTNYRKIAGTKLREWFLQTHSNEKWGKIYEAILWGISEKKLPKFYKTPLKKPLNFDEVNYHSFELQHAPTFPNYR